MVQYPREITDADVDTGDLYAVTGYDELGTPSNIVVTWHKDLAIEKFNQLVEGTIMFFEAELVTRKLTELEYEFRGELRMLTELGYRKLMGR